MNKKTLIFLYVCIQGCSLEVCAFSKKCFEKIQKIQNTSGVSIALADDNRSVMDKVLKEVLLNPEKAQNKFAKQIKLDFGASPELDELDVEITNEIEAAREKAEKILHKSEAACLISNSVKAKVTMTPNIIVQ